MRARRLLKELRAGCAEPVGTGRLHRALAEADLYLRPRWWRFW